MDALLAAAGLAPEKFVGAVAHHGRQILQAVGGELTHHTRAEAAMLMLPVGAAALVSPMAVAPRCVRLVAALLVQGRPCPCSRRPRQPHTRRLSIRSHHLCPIFVVRQRHTRCSAPLLLPLGHPSQGADFGRQRTAVRPPVQAAIVADGAHTGVAKTPGRCQISLHDKRIQVVELSRPCAPCNGRPHLAPQERTVPHHDELSATRVCPRQVLQEGVPVWCPVAHTGRRVLGNRTVLRHMRHDTRRPSEQKPCRLLCPTQMAGTHMGCLHMEPRVGQTTTYRGAVCTCHALSHCRECGITQCLGGGDKGMIAILGSGQVAHVIRARLAMPYECQSHVGHLFTVIVRYLSHKIYA